MAESLDAEAAYRFVNIRLFETAVINKGYLSLDLSDSATLAEVLNLTTEDKKAEFEHRVFILRQVPPHIKFRQNVQQSPEIEWSTPPPSLPQVNQDLVPSDRTPEQGEQITAQLLVKNTQLNCSSSNSAPPDNPGPGNNVVFTQNLVAPCNSATPYTSELPNNFAEPDNPGLPNNHDIMCNSAPPGNTVDPYILDSLNNSALLPHFAPQFNSAPSCNHVPYNPDPPCNHGQPNYPALPYNHVPPNIPVASYNPETPCHPVPYKSGQTSDHVLQYNPGLPCYSVPPCNRVPPYNPGPPNYPALPYNPAPPCKPEQLNHADLPCNHIPPNNSEAPYNPAPSCNPVPYNPRPTNNHDLPYNSAPPCNHGQPNHLVLPYNHVPPNNSAVSYPVPHFNPVSYHPGQSNDHVLQYNPDLPCNSVPPCNHVPPCNPKPRNYPALPYNSAPTCNPPCNFTPPYTLSSPCNHGLPHNQGQPNHPATPYNHHQPCNSAPPCNHGPPYKTGAPNNPDLSHNYVTQCSSVSLYNNGASYNPGQPSHPDLPYNSGPQDISAPPCNLPPYNCAPSYNWDSSRNSAPPYHTEPQYHSGPPNNPLAPYNPEPPIHVPLVPPFPPSVLPPQAIVGPAMKRFPNDMKGRRPGKRDGNGSSDRSTAFRKQIFNPNAKEFVRKGDVVVGQHTMRVKKEEQVLPRVRVTVVPVSKIVPSLNPTVKPESTVASNVQQAVKPVILPPVQVQTSFRDAVLKKPVAPNIQNKAALSKHVAPNMVSAGTLNSNETNTSLNAPEPTTSQGQSTNLNSIKNTSTSSKHSSKPSAAKAPSLCSSSVARIDRDGFQLVRKGAPRRFIRMPRAMPINVPEKKKESAPLLLSKSKREKAKAKKKEKKNQAKRKKAAKESSEDEEDVFEAAMRLNEKILKEQMEKESQEEAILTTVEEVTAEELAIITSETRQEPPEVQRVVPVDLLKLDIEELLLQAVEDMAEKMMGPLENFDEEKEEGEDQEERETKEKEKGQEKEKEDEEIREMSASDDTAFQEEVEKVELPVSLGNSDPQNVQIVQTEIPQSTWNKLFLPNHSTMLNRTKWAKMIRLQLDAFKLQIDPKYTGQRLESWKDLPMLKKEKPTHTKERSRRVTAFLKRRGLERLKDDSNRAVHIQKVYSYLYRTYCHEMGPALECLVKTPEESERFHQIEIDLISKILIIPNNNEEEVSQILDIEHV